MWLLLPSINNCQFIIPVSQLAYFGNAIAWYTAEKQYRALYYHPEPEEKVSCPTCVRGAGKDQPFDLFSVRSDIAPYDIIVPIHRLPNYPFISSLSHFHFH